MIKPHAIILVMCLLAASAAAQNGPRIFDNFDTARGVNVVLPPAAPLKAVAKKNSKKKRGAAAADSNLVKKTAMTVAVTDGLAQRESAYPIRNRLVMGSGTHLKGFTTGDPQHDSYIVESSRRYGIDPLLIYSQMHQESSFKIRARSHKGASGLMQLMPATARRFGVTQIWDPKQNIDAGVRYMRWLLDTFGGDVNLALAGYNAGEGAVWKYGNIIPPYRETMEYVRRISARYNAISDPRYVQSARSLNTKAAAKLVQKEARPLTVWEPNALAVRLPDGKIMLVNQ